MEEEEDDILAEIRDILKDSQEEKEKPIYITYPAAGGTKTITKGTTQLNLYTGDVFLADGSEETLSAFLRAHGKKYARSLEIIANKSFVVQLDDGGKHTVDADKIYAPTHQECQRISIKVEEATAISFWASTNPAASIEVPKTQSVLISKGSKFNTSVTADTNIFSSDLGPSYSCSIFRIYACFNISGILSVKRKRSGTTVTEKLNDANTITADAAYSFDILVETGESINLQYSVAVTALKIVVAELGGGT